MSLRDLESALAEYLQASPPAGLEDMLTVIRRYTAIWLDGRSAIPTESETSVPTIADRRTTREYDSPFDLFPHVDRVPFLFRMHHLRQLSTVGSTIHFAAQHTRFSHALGATAVAKGLLNSVQTDGFHVSGEQMTFIQSTACQFYCLLHDAFHGPFGHSLDIMKDVFDARPVEKLDDKYLREGLRAAIDDPNDPIGAQLAAAADLWVGKERRRELLELVLLLSQKRNVEREAPCLLFLRDIVDSIADADRIDYVIRDGFFLTGKDYRDDIVPMISSARAVQWEEESDGDTAAEEMPEVISDCREGGDGDVLPPARLAFSLRHKQEVEDLLGYRRQFYTQFYEAPEKLVVDDMICHAVYYVLRDKGVLDRREDRQAKDTRRQLLRNILLLTDEDFIPALLELKATLPCYELLLRYRQRRFFVKVHTVGVRLDELPLISDKAREWIGDIEAFLQEKAAEAGITYYAEVADERDEAQVVGRSRKFFDGLDDALLEEMPDAEEKLLNVGFQKWIQGNFRARHDFERQVWSRLTKTEDAEGLLAAVAEEEYGDSKQRVRFDEFPPLHVTISSFFNFPSRGSVRLHRKEGHGSEQVLFYDPETKQAKLHEVVPAVKEDFPSYPLVLSTLPSVLERFGKDRLRTALVEQLREFDWIWKASVPSR